MNVLIENYRGIEIIFNNETERFSFTIDTGSWREKQSYAACKKNIDDYLKANATFEPFYVRNKGTGDKIKIIGIRKDNRFIKQLPNGGNDQISEYDEKDYIDFKESDETYYATIAILELERDAIWTKIKEQRSLITGTTLKEMKSKYIMPA